MNALIGDNGIITKAEYASDASKFAAYKEEMDINLSDSITCSGTEMKKYMKSMDDKDIDKFLVLNGKLMYIGNDDYEREVAEDVGINTSLSTGNYSVEDLKVLAGNVLPLGNEVEVPVGNSGETPEELVGTRLYDKVPQNEDKWDIVIEYNENNEKIKTHGTGYYYLKKGTYIIDGKSVTLENDYIIDYRTREFYALGNKYREWNIGETLAVKDPMPVLNLDPTNFEEYVNEDGTLNAENLKNDANIEKIGDVSYSKENKALLFNKSPENEKGEGGYLRLQKTGIDFLTGITFEFYGNFSRLRYRNSEHSGAAFGVFSRCPIDFSSYNNQMRFGWAMNNCLMDLRTPNTGICEDTSNLFGIPAGGYGVHDIGFEINVDVYMTVVYIPYDLDSSNDYKSKYPNSYSSKMGNYDEEMDNRYNLFIQGKADDYYDKLLYYINGENLGYTHCSHNDYIDGSKGWNNDNYLFHVGVSPWHHANEIFYLQGSCYATRLYASPLTPEEVKSNFDLTQQYRNSF